jgi:shikimate dehydrogenase
MHEAALLHFGLEGSYELFDIETAQLGERVKSLVAGGITGFNITVPHKTSIFEMCSERSAKATASGAVNTVVVHGSKLSGYNTDIEGFKVALQSAYDRESLVGLSVGIIGAGGAARAALLALEELKPKHILLFARNSGKAAEMLKTVAVTTPVLVKSLPSTRIDEPLGAVIQTTSIGLQGDNEAYNWLAWFDQGRDDQLFFDMVYSHNGKPTPLVEYFSQRGVRAVDGTDMLVHQARYSFQFWTGQLPPFEVMKSALVAARQARASQ